MAVYVHADTGPDAERARLLLHLPDPALALRRMADALRPGGRLLVEDADYVTMLAADPEHPRAAAFDRAIARQCDALASAGLVDLRFGRRLPGLVARLGLTELGVGATVALRRGGAPRRPCCDSPSTGRRRGRALRVRSPPARSRPSPPRAAIRRSASSTPCP